MSELLVNGKIAIAVMFDVVSISIHTGDEYQAQVLHDDLLERLEAGQGITVGMRQPEGN